MGSLKHENPVNILCLLSWEQKQLSNKKGIRFVYASHFVIMVESLSFLFTLFIGARTVFPTLDGRETET